MTKSFGFMLSISIMLVVAAPEASAAKKDHRGDRQSLPGASVDSDFYDDGNPGDAKVALGAQLFFDKVLSGNLNIACATCHHSFTGTADGLALPVGEGARGLGVTRDTGVGSDAVHERVPRNAPHVFNAGAREFERLFHDGRVQPDAAMPNGIQSPAGFNLPEGLENALAVQAMFPVTSATEMAGQTGENPVADAAAVGDLSGPDGVWEQLAERLRGISAYVDQFVAVYDDVNSAEDIEFTHAANAIAAFEAVNWRSDNSPFDRYLRREPGAMSAAAKAGMSLFYDQDKGNCAGCHSGTFQTDQSFRAIAMPQTGPGKGDGAYGYEDFGRERVTGSPSDRYKFRVPSLRNVTQTAPYGHAGAYDTLEAVVRHHLNPVAALYNYDPSQLRLPSRSDLDARDSLAMSDPAVLVAIADANELMPVSLSEREIKNLMDFLYALTDPAVLDLRNNVPRSVPSGLALAE